MLGSGFAISLIKKVGLHANGQCSKGKGFCYTWSTFAYSMKINPFKKQLHEQALCKQTTEMLAWLDKWQPQPGSQKDNL